MVCKLLYHLLMKTECVYCGSRNLSSSGTRKIKKLSSYFRKSDGQRLSRFWCSSCKKSFSAASLSPKKGHKKRHLRATIVKLLVGGMSQRETARTLGINRKTVVRQFRFSFTQARAEFNQLNQNQVKALEVEFDDLETFEHTKCKPLSVTLMVEYKTRRILGFKVSQMPAKGHLAQISRKKYGPRIDKRAQGRQALFTEVRSLLNPEVLIRSDSNPHYPADVQRHFPQARHETVLGGRGAVTGQGELKKLKWDPIFSLNHTCAMLRANINRLFRKTWCTTKRPDQLEGHILLYALSHNLRILTE